jgi:FKBP-type peptidyl-prolyl cis-trans isomerase
LFVNENSQAPSSCLARFLQAKAMAGLLQLTSVTTSSPCGLFLEQCSNTDKSRSSCRLRGLNLSQKSGRSGAKLVCCEAKTSDSATADLSNSASTSSSDVLKAAESADARAPSSRKRQAESTDFIASAITRRFGLGAGLAWVGFLAFGVISEQIKTRLEVYREESDTRDVTEQEEVTLADGVKFVDLRIGGGSSPMPGDLVLISIVGTVQGQATPFIDSTSNGRDKVYAFKVKPYPTGICYGLEEAMSSMKQGGKRKVVVPPEQAFGVVGSTVGAFQIPGDKSLEYVVELKRVSIPPS